MDNILDKWKKDWEANDSKNDYSLPKAVEGSDMSEQEFAQYRNELDNLREEMSFENQYKKAMSEIIQMNENEMSEQKLLDKENISSIKVIRAKCPDCGAELISKFPPMFNPYTQERQCVHHCECGKKYNLEYSYPRLAFYNDRDEEVFAHCE